MKVQGHSRAAQQPTLAGALKELEKKAVHAVDQKQHHADAELADLEKLAPAIQSELAPVHEQIDHRFSLERAALEAKFSGALSLLDQAGIAQAPAQQAAAAPHSSPHHDSGSHATHPATSHAGGKVKAHGPDLKKIPQPYRHWAPDIEAAAKKYKMPPAFIAAVMQRETNGRNVIGDGGHGHGLMQIDDRFHGAWLRSHHNGLDPKSNIDYGTSILRANLNTAHKLGLTGDKALKFAASAYNSGVGGAENGLRHGDSDRFTTGHNYGHDVLQKMKHFEAGFGKGTSGTHAAHGSHKSSGGSKAHGSHKSHGSSAISKKGHEQMKALEHAAQRYASGKRPQGWCLKKVEDYLQTVSYGKIGHGNIPRFAYAHQFADYLNADHRYQKLGLKKLDLDNPYKAPPGAIIVVRAGTPGTHHPFAGDIVVKGPGSHFYNDGEMGYGGPQNFPKGNHHVLGIYVPA